MTELIVVKFGDAEPVTVRKDLALRLQASPWYRDPRFYSPAIFVAVPDPERPLPNEENL
jgi:hypothetical protein